MGWFGAASIPEGAEDSGKFSDSSALLRRCEQSDRGASVLGRLGGGVEACAGELTTGKLLEMSAMVRKTLAAGRNHKP